MTDVMDMLQYYKFHEAGLLTLSESGVPEFQLNPVWYKSGALGSHCGVVYLWLDITDESAVKYVGKAGKTLQKRLSEHVGGFRGGSKTGLRNAALITHCLSQNGCIKVFARHSGMMQVNDEMINSYSIDEESFIMKFRNMGFELWNS